MPEFRNEGIIAGFPVAPAASIPDRQGAPTMGTKCRFRRIGDNTLGATDWTGNLTQHEFSYAPAPLDE